MLDVRGVAATEAAEVELEGDDREPGLEVARDVAVVGEGVEPREKDAELEMAVADVTAVVLIEELLMLKLVEDMLSVRLVDGVIELIDARTELELVVGTLTLVDSALELAPAEATEVPETTVEELALLDVAGTILDNVVVVLV
ncbi:hypothetical protein LTR04_002905 [Oleoguttula sp. CCFEE 6159]|nr:hypothetical protein LTR04_002905 [Oleoguttula sp. CCFEE 6159]